MPTQWCCEGVKRQNMRMKFEQWWNTRENSKTKAGWIFPNVSLSGNLCDVLRQNWCNTKSYFFRTFVGDFSHNVANALISGMLTFPAIFRQTHCLFGEIADQKQLRSLFDLNPQTWNLEPTMNISFATVEFFVC